MGMHLEGWLGVARDGVELIFMAGDGVELIFMFYSVHVPVGVVGVKEPVLGYPLPYRRGMCLVF